MEEINLKLEQVMKRLDVLENERAILDTLYRYGPSLDYGIEEQYVDCFTEDGVRERRDRPGSTKTGNRVQGRVALAAHAAQHTRAPGKYHKHMVIEPRITLNGDEARVESYFTRLDASDDHVPFVYVFGRYRDHMVKCPDGKWRFKERIIELEARAPSDTTS